MKFDVSITPSEAIREIGRRLRMVRLGRNMTRADLAKRSGVAERTLARLENGEGNVRMEAFASVCSVLALLSRFDLLFPEQRISPEGVFRNEKIRSRARKSGKAAIVWGDGK